jgi:hypothetical protein
MITVENRDLCGRIKQVSKTKYGDDEKKCVAG